MKVSYLGQEIEVRKGAHGEETAFIGAGRDLRCFLGGLAEARRFVRERKAGPCLGPKPATWEVTLSDSGCVSVYGQREHAADSVRYFRDQGRVPTLTRTEWCPYPGCDGHGEVTGSRRKGQMFASTRPCPCHVEPERVAEPTPQLRGIPTCPVCLEPAHASESDDLNRHEGCQ